MFDSSKFKEINDESIFNIILINYLKKKEKDSIRKKKIKKM